MTLSAFVACGVVVAAAATMLPPGVHSAEARTIADPKDTQRRVAVCMANCKEGEAHIHAFPSGPDNRWPMRFICSCVGPGLRQFEVW